MDVFDLDRALVSDYERFARSFTQIRAPDIRRQVEELYASDRFWPEPLVTIEQVPQSASLWRPGFVLNTDQLFGKEAARLYPKVIAFWDEVLENKKENYTTVERLKA